MNTVLKEFYAGERDAKFLAWMRAPSGNPGCQGGQEESASSMGVRQASQQRLA